MSPVILLFGFMFVTIAKPKILLRVPLIKTLLLKNCIAVGAAVIITFV